MVKLDEIDTHLENKLNEYTINNNENKIDLIDGVFIEFAKNNKL
jgi:hypothetical protein